MHLHVCPLEALEDTLETSGADHLISLSGPGKSLVQPLSVSHFFAREFNDIAEERPGLIAPSLDDVRAIISHVDKWRGADAIVFQCWMGISRSTAAAVIAALTLKPDLKPQTIAAKLRSVSPSATPNPMMISHADDLMEYQGELITAIAAIGRGEDAFIGTPFSLDLDAAP